MQTYADPADREILCILLIEHKDAIDDIEAIVRVPGVDACLIAPFDLAMSYGYRDGPDARRGPGRDRARRGRRSGTARSISAASRSPRNSRTP